MAKVECCGTLAEALTSNQQNLDGAEEEPSHQPVKKLEAMVLTMQHPTAVPVVLDEQWEGDPGSGPWSWSVSTVSLRDWRDRCGQRVENVIRSTKSQRKC